jgi:small redox-active disulfide protein 2
VFGYISAAVLRAGGFVSAARSIIPCLQNWFVTASPKEAALKIQVLGSGCARCKNLTANAETALQEVGVEAEVEKVTAIEEIMAHQVFATPALVIDGSVKSAGRIASPAEIADWIAAAKKETEARPHVHNGSLTGE